MAMLMRSSETELGAHGRERALWLKNLAQTALESSWNSRWIDLSLAEAALVRRVLIVLRIASHLVSFLDPSPLRIIPTSGAFTRT